MSQETQIKTEQDYIEYLKKELSKNRIIKESDILSDIQKYSLNEDKVVNLLIDASMLLPVSNNDSNIEKEFFTNLYK